MIPANDNEPLRFLSVCSGIEAASVAWNPLGWQAVAFSEIEKFPSAVLAHHYPETPNLGDFTKIDPKTLGRVDIFCGGTPCQAFSVAGLRNSLADARGNLSLEFVRLAHELADGNGLRNVVWENVPGVLNTKDNAFGCFLGGLVGAGAAVPPPSGTRWPRAGLVSGPKGRASWGILDAQHFGLAQRRKRVIVVADFGNGADPAAVLFELASLRGYSPQSRKAGEGVAGTVTGGARKGGGYSTDDIPLTAAHRGHGDYGPGMPSLRAKGGDAAGGSEALVYAPEIARCVATREGSSQDYETTTMVATCVTGDIAHTLKAEGADASEDGTGRGTPIIAFDTTQITSKANRSVPKPGDPRHPLSASAHPPAIAFSAKDYGGDASEKIAPTLRAGGHSGSHANAGVMPAVAWTITQDSTPAVNEEMSPALKIGTGLEMGQPPCVMPGISYAADVAPTLSRESFSPTKSSSGQQADWAVVASAVRRLTPVECERLQGFPDGYTNIPWRGKDASPDGPRYKALGNSWAVPKFRWLGERIARLMPKTAANDNFEAAARKDAA